MRFVLTLCLTLFATTAFALPTFTPQLVLKNQQGETSVNYVQYPGTTFIGGKVAANSVLSNLTGSIAYPIANTYAAVSAKLTPAMLLTGFSSGAGTVAGTDTVLQGINKLSGDLQNKTVLANVLTGFSAGAGTVSSTDTVLGGLQKIDGNMQSVPVISNVLTGFSAGAGTVSSADTILGAFQKVVGNANSLQAKGLIPGTVEAISSAGAVSVSIMESTVSNASTTYAVTLAAPSSQDGQVKIIKAVTTMTGTVTLALTNVVMSGGYTPSGTTTLTFTNVGDSAVFIAVGAKWVYIGGSAVAS